MSRSLFVTRLYEAAIEDRGLLDGLAASIRAFANDDGAGRRWSRDHGYRGYTSYASLDDLPRRDPDFAALARLLTGHAGRFAAELGFAGPRKLRLDSLWVNLLRGGGAHSAHIHPHSVLSGTLYIEVPPGAGSIRFEDPRLAMMMAAPVRSPDAPEELRQFISLDPEPGQLLLWESWLRHEVRVGSGRGERLSVSFNFA